MSPSQIDYIYPIAIAIMGILMAANPRAFMRKAKYDAESLKTESLLKKMGIGLVVVGILIGIYMFMR